MGSRYGRYVAVAGLIALFGLALAVQLTHKPEAAGIRGGSMLPPFAAPLVLGGPGGDVNVARSPNDGAAGRRPACEVRGPGILNVCALYRQGPVVIALFIDEGSCQAVVGQLDELAPAFPGVGFAAVAVGGDERRLARLARSQRPAPIPVAIDRDRVLASLYRMIGCPQITFAYPGGRVAGAPLLEPQPLAVLRSRITALLAASRARGWRQPAAPATTG